MARGAVGRCIQEGLGYSPEGLWLWLWSISEGYLKAPEQSLEAYLTAPGGPQDLTQCPLDKSAYSFLFCSGVSRPKHFLNYLENAKPTSKPILQILLGNLPRPSFAFVQP